MAQEDEILSLHDALLASIEKNENSRSSFGDDDEINDEELTALRFAALISKKSKHHSKPQPISTTVPAVPSAGPTSQNHPVPPAPTISKLAPRTHVPSGTFANPFQGQPFRPFFGHQQDKRTSNLIVIQTHQSHQQKKIKNFNKEHSHTKQETSSGKSALLRPQDKWDKSREETKPSESPQPKVSAKFRRLMSRDSDSDDSDSDDDSDGRRTDPESLFVCPEPDERPIASYSDDDDNDEKKSLCSVSHSDLDTSDVKYSDKETNEITSDVSDDENSNKSDTDGDKDRAVADLDVTRPTSHRSLSSSEESLTPKSNCDSLSSDRTKASSRSRSQSPASSVMSSIESHSVYSRSPSNHSTRSSKSRPSRSPLAYKSPGSSSRCHSPVMSTGRKQSSRPSASVSPCQSHERTSPRSPSPHRASRSHKGRSPSLSPHYSRSSFRSVRRHSRSRSPLYTDRYRRSPRRYSRSPSLVHAHHHNRSSPKYSGSPPSRHTHRRRCSGSPNYSPRHNRSQRKHRQSPSHPRPVYAETSRRHSRSPPDACKCNRSPRKCSVSPSSKSHSHRSRSPVRCSSFQRDRHWSCSPRQARSAHSQSPVAHKQRSGWMSEKTRIDENRLRSNEKDYWDKPPTREELSRSTQYKARPVRSDKPKATKDHQSTRVSGENLRKGQGRSSSLDQGSSHRKAGEKVQKRNGQKGRGHSSDRCSAGLSVSRNHPSGSQDKENKCHKNDEKQVPDMKSSLLSQTKKSSLSPEEQAKLEARQRKFASLSEVKVSEPKKISLKDIVRSTEQDKDNSNQDSQLPKRHVHENVNVDASNPQQDKTGRNGSDKEDGKLHKKGICQSSPSDIKVEKPEQKKKKQEVGSRKSHQASVKDSDKKDHRSVRGLVVRSLLSVVTTAKGSRDVSHKHDDRSINLTEHLNRGEKLQIAKEKAESRNDIRTESEVEHEDARQIILRMKQQKAKEMSKRPKSPVGQNVRKNEKASKAVSPTISVTFSDCQSRLPIYRHLDQSPLKQDRNQELTKNVMIKVRSELHGGVDGQNRCKKSETIPPKTLDLRDVLESRKDGSEMRTGFKRKGKKTNPEEDSGEKKKIRLKRPGRLEVRSAVVNATD